MNKPKIAFLIMTWNNSDANDVVNTSRKIAEWLKVQQDAGYELKHESYTPVINETMFVTQVIMRVELKPDGKD